MISYSIGILTLICEFRAVHKPCHTIMVRMGRWRRKEVQGYPRSHAVLDGEGKFMGLIPGSNKEHLCSLTADFLREEKYFRGMGVREVTGRRYLCGFVGDPVTEKAWLDEKVKGWTNAMEVLSTVVRQHPQTAYAGLQKFL